MANPYSILHNYDQPVHTPDFNFIQTGLAYKQGHLNENRQKLQSAVDKFAILDVYRDVDKGYVEERLEAVMQVANKYANGDVSSDAFTNSILKNINQVVDPRVKNAVLSTRKFRNEQAQWEKLKEKEPDAYNDNNYAYSLQASESWRKGQEPGEIYSGGGGVRKYVDYNKTIRENIPKIQEMLEAEWIEDAGVGVGGYFREISTKRAVDRGKMENALNTFLGGKEMDQMRIDAWAKYSRMDDESLERQYNGYFSPQLEASQENVEKYTKLIEQEQNPTKKAEYQRLLDLEEKNVNSISTNSFDNVVEKVGKEAAYTTLFSRQYKDSYLDAYSYAPLEIKREVNQLDVENRNLEMKLREYDLSKTNADRDYDLAVRKQELEEMKASGNGVLGNSGLPLLGDLAEVDQTEGYGEGKLGHLKAQQKLEGDAINNMKGLLSESFGNLSQGQLMQLGGQLNDIAGKDKITVKIDGKTTVIDVRDPKNFQTVKNFQNYVLNDSPVKKFEQQGVLKIISQIKSDLTKVGRGENPDIDLSALPDFGSKLVPGDRDENGKVLNYKVAKNDYSGGSYYGYLLKKSNRTDAEEATLDLYTSMHLISDPTLSQEQRKSVFSTIQNNIYSKIDGSSVKQLPQNWFSAYGVVKGHSSSKIGLINQIKTSIDGAGSWGGLGEDRLEYAQQLGFGPQIQEYEKLYRKLKTAQGSEKTAIKNRLSQIEKSAGSVLAERTKEVDNSLISGTVLRTSRTPLADFYLSDFSSGDLEWSGGGTGRGFDDYIKNSFTALSSSLEQQLSSQNMEMSLREQIYTPGQGSVYESLAYSIGLPKGSKVPITLVRKVDGEGNPTGQVDWKYTGGTPSKPVQVSSQETGKPLTAEQISSLGIKYGGSERPQYRASYGENAPKVELGSSKVDKEVENRVRRTYQSLPMDDIDKYLAEAEKYGVQPVVGEAINKFDNGAYKFKLVPENGTWNRVITINNKEIYREDLRQGDYSDEEMRNLYDNAYYDNQVVFHNYLIELIQEAQRSAKINAAAQR